jgi:hypothetical protein
MMIVTNQETRLESSAVSLSATPTLNTVVPSAAQSQGPWPRVRSGVVALAALGLIYGPGTPLLTRPSSEPVQRQTRSIHRLIAANEFQDIGVLAGHESTPFLVDSADAASQLEQKGNERGVRDRRVAREAAFAAQQLATWLRLSETETARIGNFSRGTLANWRRGRGAYGSSSRHLLSVYALISQLVRLQGLERASLWLQGDAGSGTSRLDRLAAGSEGLQEVLASAEPLIFASISPAKVAISADHDARRRPDGNVMTPDEEDAAFLSSVMRRRGDFAAPPIRPRHI